MIVQSSRVKNIYSYIYIHIIVLEARALEVKETQALELQLFPRVPPIDRVQIKDMYRLTF